MVPPRLIRRLVLAPLVIVIAFGFIVLSPFLALASLVSGLLARSRAGRMRSLRLVGFALVWLVAETAALIMLAGLWVVSGFGGRLRTEPYQSRHYGVMRWFLDAGHLFRRRELDPGPVAPRDQAAGAPGPPGSGRTGQGHAQPAPAAPRRGARRYRGLPGRRRDLRGARRAGQHQHGRRRME